MRQIMFTIDSDDVDRPRPGWTDGETWNGFAVVYVTGDTLKAFITDNGGEYLETDEGIIARWPDEWCADDDMLARVRTDVGTLYTLHGWCAEIVHKHSYREDIADYWCLVCDTVTDFCRQTNPF